MKLDYKIAPSRIYAEAEDGKLLAEVTFPKARNGEVQINHTFVDDSLRGQGIAAELMELAYEEIKTRGDKAVPLCTYAVKWYGEHPEKRDIVA
jgi:predicted GNAT family acetyltransferase